MLEHTPVSFWYHNCFIENINNQWTLLKFDSKSDPLKTHFNGWRHLLNSFIHRSLKPVEKFGGQLPSSGTNNGKFLKIFVFLFLNYIETSTYREWIHNKTGTKYLFSNQILRISRFGQGPQSQVCVEILEVMFQRHLRAGWRFLATACSCVTLPH